MLKLQRASTNATHKLADFSNVAATEQILDSELESLLRLPQAAPIAAVPDSALENILKLPPAKPSVESFTAGMNPVSSSIVGRGISRSIAGVGETVSYTLEALSDILGAKHARDFWREKGDSLADLSRNIPIKIESAADVNWKSLPDIGAYAALAVGQLIPQIALSMGSGLAARAAAAGLSPIKQLVATVAGTALPSVVQETGGISNEIRQTSGELRPEIAFPAGLLAGVLDTLTPSRLLGKIFDEAADEVKKKTWTALVKQTFKELPKYGKEIGKFARTEAITEIAQESIAISANKFADSTYEMVTGQNFLRVLDAGLQGMIGGGVIGAATPAVQGLAQREVVDTTPRRKEGQASLKSEPLVESGFVRLYRGGTIGDEGNWFTEDRDTALFHMGNGRLDGSSRISFVDIPQADLGKYDAFANPRVISGEWQAEPGDIILPDDLSKSAKTLHRIAGYKYPLGKAPITFVGYQETGLPDKPPYPAFNVTEAFAGFTKDTTVGGPSLQRAGVTLPAVPTFEEWQASKPEATPDTDYRRKGQASLPISEPENVSRKAILASLAAAFGLKQERHVQAMVDDPDTNHAVRVAFQELYPPQHWRNLAQEYGGTPEESYNAAFAKGVDILDQAKRAITSLAPTERAPVAPRVAPQAQPARGLATEIPPELQTPATVANTVEELRVKLPTSGLAPEHQSLISAFLDTKAVKYLDGMQFAIRDVLENGWQGSYFGDLIELARNSNSDTGPHEFMHRLFDVLPDSDKARIRKARLDTIQKIVLRGTNSFDLDALSEFAKREVASDEFVGKKWNRELYPLTSDAEYFAGTMSGKFIARLSAPSGLIARVKEAIRDLWAALKKAFKLPQTSDQIFRNLMNGRYDVTPLVRQPGTQASVRPIIKVRDLERVVAEKAVYDPAAIPTEAVLATGQSLNLQEQLGNELAAVVPEANRTRVGRWLGFNHLDDISNYVAYVLSVIPQNYAQAKATLATHAGGKGLTNLLALHANRGLELFETRVLRVKKLMERQRAYLASPKFISKIGGLSKAELRASAIESARKSIEASLRSGLAAAVVRVREAGANEALFDAADVERRFYEGLLDNSRTLVELVQDIAGRVAMTPTGVSIMGDGDALVREYLAALPFDQRPRIDPVTRRNERLAMIKVAAEILARNTELRKIQLAAIWSEQTKLNAPVRSIEDQLVKDLVAGKSPSAAIGPLITNLRNLANDEGKAAAVVAAKYKAILREIGKLTDLEYADLVARNLMESASYRAFRTEVARDAGAEVRPTEAKDIDIGSPFFTEHTIFMPDGHRVVLRMHQDAAGYAETERQSTQAATELNTWLHAAENANSPFLDYYKRQYDTLEAVWHSSTFQNPPKQFVFWKDFHFKVIDVWLGIFDGLMRNIGTRSTGLVRMAANMWKDSNHQFSNWTALWKFPIIQVNVKGAKSHPDIWEPNSRGNAVQQWSDEIMTPIFALSDDPIRDGLRAGSQVPGYGHIVTAEDMEAVRLQVRAASAGHAIDITKGREKLVTRTLIEDRIIPGVPFLRLPAVLSKNMIFRRFNKTDIPKSYVAKMVKLAEDKAPAAQIAQAQEQFWDIHWDFVQIMVVDRSAEFSTIVPFESAIAAAQQEVTPPLGSTVGNIANVRDLADFLAANGNITPDEALDFVLTEMDKHNRAVERRVRQNKDLNAGKIQTIEDENPWTTNRGARIAPFIYYQYGFSQSRDIHNFATSGSSFYFETFLKSMASLKIDLQAVATDVKTKIEGLAKQTGPTLATQQVYRDNLKDIELGNATARYADLQTHIAGLDKYTTMLRDTYKPGGKSMVDELSVINRVLGTFVAGILFSEYTLTRNAIEGGFLWNGIRLSKIYGSTLQAFPQAFMQLFFNTLKLGFNTVPAVARGVTKLHPFRAVATLAHTGNILAAEKDLFGDAVMEVANSMFGKQQLYRDIEAAGLALPVYPKEQLGAMAEMPFTGGEITQEDYSDVPLLAMMQKGGGALLTFLDAQMALFVRPLSPRIGDLLANMTIGSSTLKGLQNLEAQARKTFAAYRDAGIPAASLRGKIFTPNQILGRWFGTKRERTTNEIREIEHWFMDVGIPLHTSIQQYFERLEAQGASAQWLTPEEKLRLISWMIEATNAATPLNRPPRFKGGTFSRTLGLLAGWPVNQYRQVGTMLSRSASDPNYQAYQLRLALGMWFIAVLAFSALGQYGIEEIMRFLAKFVRGEERATRQPTEQEGERAARAWLIYAFNTIPLVSTAVNSAFNDMPGRASFSPNILIQSKLIELGNYVSGAYNSRDPLYRLPQLVKGFIPGASVLLNRLPSTEGSVNVMNVARLYRRYGEPETLRTQRGAQGGAGATATRLTPYGERIINAVARRDTTEAIRLKNEAIKVATEMGKADPERSVEQMILNRLPERRAFAGTISEQQYGAVLSKMTAGERNYTTQTTANLAAGLTALGIGVPRLQASGRARRGRRGQSRLFAGRRRRGLSPIRARRQRRRRIFA